MNALLKWKLARIIITSIYLYAGWMLFTVNVSLTSLLIGAFFSVAGAVLTYGVFIDVKEAGRRFLLPRLHHFVMYFLFLIFEIYVSSFKVVVKVITGNINPRIVHPSEEKDSDWEGCLSFLELLVLVPRHRKLRLDYLNREGEPRSLELSDYAARVVQHEYDHLDGVLTIDRALTTRDIIKASELDAVE